MIWLVSTDHAWKPPADAAQAAQIFFSPFFLQLYHAVVVQGSWFYWFFFSISPGNESWGNEKFWKCASLKAENGLSLSSGFHRFICQETFVVSGYICKLDESATDCCSIESVERKTKAVLRQQGSSCLWAVSLISKHNSQKLEPEK